VSGGRAAASRCRINLVVTKPVALVTGASAGIGATFARALAARGYDLILVARRRERLEDLARELKQAGAEAEVLQADLTDPAQLRLVEQRIAAVEALNLVVNNAGFGVVGRFWESDADAQLAMHLLHMVETGEDMEKDLVIVMPADFKRYAGDLARSEESETHAG